LFQDVFPDVVWAGNLTQLSFTQQESSSVRGKLRNVKREDGLTQRRYTKPKTLQGPTEPVEELCPGFEVLGAEILLTVETVELTRVVSATTVGAANGSVILGPEVF
jgi:hypothetical protein